MKIIDAPVSGLPAFRRRLAWISAHRSTGDADFDLYKRLKAELVRDVPDLSPREYDSAVREIARVAGV